MKTREFRAAFSAAVVVIAAVAGFSAAGTGTAAAEECTGPFRQCAIHVNAVCTRDRDGKQRMTYWDHPGNVSSFETCVGRIFEAAGQPNPYKSPGALVQRGGRQVARSNLTVPYTELLYPLVDP